MSNGKKENSSSTTIVSAIAAAIGTALLAVLTAQNAPWWVSKFEGISGGSSKPVSSEELPLPKTTPSVPNTPASASILTPTPTPPTPPTPTPITTPATVPPQPASPLLPIQPLPSPIAERWKFMGVSTKTREEIYVDNGSINNSSGTIRFTYKIGNDLISASADCDANRWYAKNKNTGEDYGWISPQSQATQSMMNYVCKS